jgi:hypothetical protein
VTVGKLVEHGTKKKLMKVFSHIPAVVTLGLALAEFLVASASPQTNPKNKPVTLTGTVTDSRCGAKHMMTGDDVNCVRACVKNGSQYALVVDQEVYPLNGRSEELNGRAGQRVMITGALDATGLEVASLKSADTMLPTQSKSSNDAEIPPATATIEGLVRDIACPIQNKNATATVFNRKCAEECAKLGSPLILLTNDGVLYTPISASMPDQDQRQRLMPFLGKYVRVTGQVFERTGTHAIVMREIHEVKNAHLITNAD